MAFFVSNKLGQWGERYAEQEYLKRGFIIVARNVYNTRGKRLGEIDLVFRTDKELIFVEVKTRRSAKFGSAVEAITKAKKQRMIRAVQWFCRVFNQYSNLQPRIDICAIDIRENLDKSQVNVIIIPSAVDLNH